MSSDNPVQTGEVKASYFWDDGSGINGDTGAPASGEPMQKGLFASPSWPLGTEGYVEYNGKKADFFIGDRGPGHPAEGCDVLLDLDGKTFAELTDSSWNSDSLTVSGGQGHLEDLSYTITKWGDGHGDEGAPHPMGSPNEKCDGAVSQLPEEEEAADGKDKEQQKSDPQPQDNEQQKAEQGQQEEQAQPEEDQQEAEGQPQEQQEADGQPEDESSDGSSTQAETAANDMSGISLVGNDLPLASGALLLALLPALLVAFIFAKRPSAVFSAAGGNNSGRHRLASLRTIEGWRRLPSTLATEGRRYAQSVRESDGVRRAQERAAQTWQRVTSGLRK
ncbi:hypothetical protein FHX37_1101 [Haloactinospora alba]|uniref:Uncharacterized protein n=1 Tax=Haloactinospora alba TaxID=405555 RepID=A0A543NH75_9ACTN|nr:hypothetical protein [Haloactinospora alba]TQN31206.1 hypothetical protein FHX37_1101 [Haloactinospora alba]